MEPTVYREVMKRIADRYESTGVEMGVPMVGWPEDRPFNTSCQCEYCKLARSVYAEFEAEGLLEEKNS